MADDDELLLINQPSTEARLSTRMRAVQDHSQVQPASSDPMPPPSARSSPQQPLDQAAERYVVPDKLHKRPSSSSLRILDLFGRNPDCRFDFLYTPFSGSMSQVSKMVASFSPLLGFVDACLRGLGQVILVNNPISGILFLIASVINCHYCCILGMVGLVTSTLFAKIWAIPREAIQDGLYGYNGYLIGHAVAIYQANDHGDWNWLLVAPVVLLCTMVPFVTTALSLFIRNIVGKPSGVFTFPFHIMTWIWLLTGERSLYFPNAPSGSPQLVNATTTETRAIFDYDWYQVGRAVPIGVGQVFFFGDFTSGLLVVAGVALYSRISGFFAVLGAAMGAFYAVAIGASETELYSGLWGYDATIVGITIGGLFVYLNAKAIPFTLMAILAAVMLHGALRVLLIPVGLPPLTFAAAVCNVVFTAIGPSFSGIIVLPLQLISSPEQHCSLNLSGKPPAHGSAPPAAGPMKLLPAVSPRDSFHEKSEDAYLDIISE
eukprot:m.188978 g.188978  ORF g.188978 m.188978 type:complete len:489 (-) comp53595_c0_seq2:120-1586(-)